MAGTPKWHKFNIEEQMNAKKHYKLKDKKYARPLILTNAEFIMMWWYEMRRCNPGQTDEEIRSFFED